MQVTCPACSTRYTTDDAKVRGKTVRMRCRACDTVWLVQGPAKDEARRGKPASVAVPETAPFGGLHTGSFGAEELATGRHEARRDSLEARTEKRAAVLRRGTDRDHRDLFASQLPDEGSIKQTLRPPPTGVGARSEDSVLFTVDSLRAAAPLQTPPPAMYHSAPTAASDDEGVIDLKALTARPSPYAVSPLGLGSEPPIGFAREVSGSSGFPAQAAVAKRAPGPWIAAGASFAAMALAALSAVLVFGGAVPQRAAHATAHLAPAAASAGSRAHALVVQREDAEKKAAEKKAAEKLSSDRAEAEKESVVAKKGGKAGRGGRAAASPAGRATTSAAAARPAPKPAGDACGCKGDFTCILRCSAKGK